MKALHALGLITVVGLVACDAPEDASTERAPQAGGKADVIDPDTGGEVYFVFSNGVFCVTAPCPSITAVGPDGSRHELADIDIAPELVDEGFGLLDGGVAVSGEIVEGLWEPLGPGDVLVVDEVVGVAQEHLVVDQNLACITAPCRTHRVYGDDGTELPLSGVDVVLDLFSSEDEHEVAQQILGSEVTAIGWVRQGDWSPLQGGNVLHVSRIVAGVQHYEVGFNGVACITAPCPSLEAVDPNGEVTDVASLNADPTLLPREEQEAELEPLSNGDSLVVKGWISEGSWTPPGPGNVMHILEFGSNEQ